MRPSAWKCLSRFRFPFQRTRATLWFCPQRSIWRFHSLFSGILEVVNSTANVQINGGCAPNSYALNTTFAAVFTTFPKPAFSGSDYLDFWYSSQVWVLYAPSAKKERMGRICSGRCSPCTGVNRLNDSSMYTIVG